MVENAEERERGKAKKRIDRSIFRFSQRGCGVESPFRSSPSENSETSPFFSFSLSSFLLSNIFHFSPRRSSFVSSSRGEENEEEGNRVIGCSSLRHGSSSKHGGFRAGVVPPRDREREEARACVSPIKARSEREIGTVGRQGTSVRNENGSLHLLEEQRRPRLLHGIASIIPVGAYLPGL